MFDGFLEEYVRCGAVTLFVCHNGATEKPALLLLDGYPQTSAMWHKLAPLLQGYHIICPDLRGYGRSDTPATDATHSPYSKRAMAGDMAALLDHFGHSSCQICSHDRGARVAHRFGLDHPQRVQRMALLDIAPTREMYRNTTEDFARAYWHWFFLILPAPMPEQMIGADPEAFWRGKVTKQIGGTEVFAEAALAEYLQAFQNPGVIHGSCEDYRAAASIDIAHDEADEGAKLTMPLLVLWAAEGAVAKCFDPLALWRARAEDVRGEALEASHYMAEEIPGQIAKRLQGFLSGG